MNWNGQRIAAFLTVLLFSQTSLGGSLAGFRLRPREASNN